MKQVILPLSLFLFIGCESKVKEIPITYDHVPRTDAEIEQICDSFKIKDISAKKIESEEIKNEVFAGRFDNVKGAKYAGIGFPKGRKWLTLSEWRGEHIQDKNKREKFILWREYYKDKFIYDMSKAALSETKVYDKIPPSLIVAQIILESNYGMSRLAISANNFFGHKYMGRDKSKFIIAADDSPTDKFTVFKSRWFCIRAHSKLLMRMYYHRVKGEPNVDNWLKALCGGGSLNESKRWVRKGNYVYATSCYNGNACYADLLRLIIDRHNLRKLDNIKNGKQKAS